MGAEQVALAHYAERKTVAGILSRLAGRVWAAVNPADLDGTWAQAAPQMLLGLAGAQLTAAQSSDRYVRAVLAQQGADGAPIGKVNPAALAGIASDGRPLDSLLRNPITVVKAGIAGGASTERSMASGVANLDMIVRTQFADAGRAADHVALVAHRQATGYVRMLVGKSCSRCVVLAGRRFQWNAAFNRHPRCDCIGVPAAEDAADDVRTDPRGYFDTLSRAEQDKTFTKAGAEAIRDGADIARVVNARRGMQTATDGRLYTTEAAGRRPRLMPEQILIEADGSRDEAIRLLRLHGYIST